MKQLTLIRHAKSSWSNVSMGDFERPLGARGLRDAPRMGAYLSEMPLPPISRMISSPALRARTTADLIAKELGLAAEQLTLEPRIYGASLSVLFELVRGLDEAEGHVVLVGHNPGFEQLARALDPNFDGDGAKYPTCGVARMQLAVETWAEVDEGSVESSRFVYPKML
jgi:phosphohistidine phosphatase